MLDEFGIYKFKIAMLRIRSISRNVLTFYSIALSMCFLGIFACFHYVLITWEDQLPINGFVKHPDISSIANEKLSSQTEEKIERIYFQYDKLVDGENEIFGERLRNLQAVGQNVVEIKNGVITTKPCSHSDLLSCKEIREIGIVGEISHGYTKVVERGLYKGKVYAVKSIRRWTEDVVRCKRTSQSTRSENECMKLAKYKLAKEIILLQELDHSNIVKLRGFCWQNELNTANIRTRGLTMVTELGSPIEVISLIQMPWHQRFRISLGLSRLVKYLEHSPMGSLIIRDFKFTQFVLVNGEVKLSDLDDVDNEEPICETEEQCIVGAFYVNRTLPCIEHRCVGHNAVTNLKSICMFFLSHILLPRAPQKLKNRLKDILSSAKLLLLDSSALLSRFEEIRTELEAGKHIIFDQKSYSQQEYRVIPQADFPGMHDYYCADSYSLSCCQLAVFSLKEAKYQCNMDTLCKAFVVTLSRTWLGHTIIYLKSNTTQMRFNGKTAVFVKAIT